MRMLKSHGRGYVCMQIDTKEQVQYYILTGMLKREMVGVLAAKGPSWKSCDSLAPHGFPPAEDEI
jgi:hypothetical protein